MVFYELFHEPANFPCRTGIEFVAQGNKLVTILPVNANHQLAVFAVLLFWFLFIRQDAWYMSVQRIYNITMCQYKATDKTGYPGLLCLFYNLVICNVERST